MKTSINRFIAMVALATTPTHAAPPVLLSSDTLGVLVDPEFPRIISYRNKTTDAVLDGQLTPVAMAEINGKAEACRVSFTRLGAAAGEYRLSFPLSAIDISLQIAVSSESVDIRFTNVKESGVVKLRTLAFSGNALVSVSAAQANAELAAVTASGYANSKEIMAAVATLPEMAKPDSGNYAFLSNGNLAAGIIGNHPEDVTRAAWQVTSRDGVKTCAVWRPVWQYREVDTETLELPWTKIILAGNRNDDGKVDWQDAALVQRRFMARPCGAEQVRDTVADQIAMNFASLAQQPFLRILDEIKKSYLITDGIGQQVTIKGYGAEGHDSANTDYGGHYNERAGGLRDLSYLLEHAGNYNTRVGVHINATEVYPEARRYRREILDLDPSGNPKGGWAWLDQSHLIDKRKDVHTGDLFRSLDQMRRELPKLDFVYLDVYGESGWVGLQTAGKINALGLPLHTEYSTALDPWTTWAHNRALNGRIFRFLWNTDRDLYENDPLLRGADHVGFMGWQGERDMHAFLRTTFGRNLPSKYLQHFELLRWEPGKAAVFSDGVKVLKSGDTVTCTRDGRVVMSWSGGGSNSRLFVPWDPLKEAKIYVWDETGTEQSWELPASWKGRTEVYLYRLTDLGRTDEVRLPVVNGRVTVKVNKAAPYVIYPEPAPRHEPMVWGEGGPVADPGFDSHQLSAWQPVPTGAPVRIENLETGDSRLMITGPAAVPTGVSQLVCGLEAGKTYAASAWVQIRGTRKAVIQVTPEGSTQSFHNWVSRTKVRNRNDSDAKLGTLFQRLRVVFTLPVACTSATLQLLAAADATGALVEFDDVRLVRTEIAPEAAKHAFFEDFEHVDQGLGPFVYASSGQTQTHLSELNESVTHDTIQGRYSFKTLNEPAGMVVRSLPSFLRLKPSTRYRLALDAIADSDLYHIVVSTRAGSPASVRLDKALPKGPSRLVENFATGTTDETFVALMKSANGGGMCVLDTIAIDELGPAPEGPAVEDENTVPAGTKLLEEATFHQALGKEWTILAPKQDDRSITVENGHLTIKAAANASAVVVRKLPVGTVAVETTLAITGATGETWGPGLGLGWAGGQMLRVNLRTPGTRFGIDSTVAPQRIVGSFPKDGEVALRIRIQVDSIIIEARCEDDEGDWQSLAEFPRNQFPGDPTEVRLGKAHGVEGTDDNADPGGAGVCQFGQFRIFGK